MKYAVFFRNVNLGRPKSPSKTQLERAFLDADAVEAQSFLTNGTIVFTARPRSNPARILTAATEQLQSECGLVEPGFLRSLTYLRELIALDPFVSVDQSAVYSCCATFLHTGLDPFPRTVFSFLRKRINYQ